MAYRFVVLASTPWWPCVAEGVPFVMRAGDSWTVMAPGEYDGPEAGAVDVIMNPHTAPELAPIFEQHAARVVLYETENLLCPTGWIETSRRTRRSCPRCRWWNYSAANAQVFGDELRPLELPARRAAPDMRRADLDVLFVGSVNARRAAVLSRLDRAHVNVVHTTGPVFGDELAALERRARVVLNMHYYEPGVFEAFRVVPAVARGARVVSEQSTGNEGAEFCDLVVPFDELADAAIELARGCSC